MSEKIKFSATAEPASEVTLLGDFTNWDERPIKMTEVSPGIYEVYVKFKKYDTYKYKYRVNGKWKEVMNDLGSPAEGTALGSYNSYNYFFCYPLRKTNSFSNAQEYEHCKKNNTRVHKEYLKLLISCIKDRDMRPWNKKRSNDNHCNIYLEGVDLSGNVFIEADLSRIQFSHANLSNCSFKGCYFNHSRMNNSNLEHSKFLGTDIDFILGKNSCSFQDAILNGSNMRHTNFTKANLRGAQLCYVVIEDCNFHNAYLEGADFSFSVVDGSTLIDTVNIDKNTLFASVGLSSARVKIGLSETLKGNIRRTLWHEKYRQGNFFKRVSRNLFIRPFWWISDYGCSSQRILSIFMSLVFLFSVFYLLNPEIISGLMLDGEPYFVTVIRALSFSTVTMITLGLGNLNAHSGSFVGYTAVGMQIVIGYMILAALVSRIAILFDSDGPRIAHKKTYKKLYP